MDGFWDALGALHLLRPVWLLAMAPTLILWFFVRRRTASPEKHSQGIAPHLAEAMTVGQSGVRNIYPIDGVAIFLVLLSIAASGPTWSRVSNPLLAQTAPMVVALEVSRSMEAPDLPPSRLERARFKIRDLVERRAGARTALIAYGGSAHRVSPLTEDPNILRAMLEALTPAVMPVQGENATQALEMARLELDRSQTPGAILFLLDELSQADAAAFSARDKVNQDVPIIFLVAAPEGTSDGSMDNLPGVSIVQLSADDRDLRAIERAAASAYRAALLGDERLEWNDRGWILGWISLPFLLMWFRRGWTMRWAIAVLLVGGHLTAGKAQADVIDWFYTPDQQGMLAARDKDFARAASLFQDVNWRGYMLFKSGQYPEAAELYSRIDTADAAVAEGMARIRNREYRPAIAAFERALELQPDHADAEWNLLVAKEILDFVETAREQSDTGEEAGIGADDVVFDNEAKRGSETDSDFVDQEEALPTVQTTEQWMRSVDTDMGDFLRQRFLQENAKGGQE